MLKRTLFAIAMAFTAVASAQASDRPTDGEILKAAQAQGIVELKTVSGLPTEHDAWSIKAVLLDAQAPTGENAFRAYAQIEANADLFIEARKHEGKTLVTPTFQTGATVSLPGTIQYKRVGLFTRSWEIKFTWENAMPPGQKVTRFADAVSTQTDEGRAISQEITRSIEAAIQRNAAEANAKKASFAMDRAAAEEKMARALERDGSEITAALEPFVGKWLPYTILTPTDDPQKPTSDFRAARIDNANADGLEITLLLGGDENAKRATVRANVSGGMLRFSDPDSCQIELAPSRKDTGEIYMLFGSRLCGVARQHVSVVFQERTPKQVADFIARMKPSSKPAEAKPLLPLPSLKP